jgi:hypothetical protein
MLKIAQALRHRPLLLVHVPQIVAAAKHCSTHQDGLCFGAVGPF